MTISPPIEKAINDRLATGLYSSPEEVLESAFAVLAAAEKEALNRIREKNLRAIQQYERGEAIPVEDFMEELRALETGESGAAA